MKKYFFLLLILISFGKKHASLYYYSICFVSVLSCTKCIQEFVWGAKLKLRLLNPGARRGIIPSDIDYWTYFVSYYF